MLGTDNKNPRSPLPRAPLSRLQHLPLPHQPHPHLSHRHHARSPCLPHLLKRFPNLKRIKFRDSCPDLDSILLQISRSGLNLESFDISGTDAFPARGMRELGGKMRDLRELSCARVRDLRDSDLAVIGECFPFVQDLDISCREYSDQYPVTDAGVIALCSKLEMLRKIDLSGNHFVTDNSLVSLSRCCKFLREIVIRDCSFVTCDGIGFVVRHSPSLESVSVNGIGFPRVESSLEEAFVLAGGLCELDLSDSFLSDELLRLVAEANSPLKKLVLSHCYCLTFDGIWYLLSKCQSLEHLDLEGSSFLTDNSIMEFCKYIRSLRFINVSFCSKLTGSAFLAIVENCTLLDRFKMENTNFGVEGFSMEIKVKAKVKYLSLAANNNLSDECIRKVAYICPHLEVLDASQCPGITEDGIVEILKNCNALRYLDISRCVGVKNLNIDFEVLKLEALRAQRLSIDDEDLAMISKRCRGLLYFDLEGCLSVTSKGVREVLQNCTRLREVNIEWCDIGADVLTWMVCKRPSLRKIILPHGFIPTKSQKNFFLRHGCVICPGGEIVYATGSLHTFRLRKGKSFGAADAKL